MTVNHVEATTTTTTTPEASPAPTPVRAVYGFVFYLLLILALAVYFLWALVPNEVLFALRITFLPQKYWAVALPIYLGVAFFLFIFVLYPSLGLCITPYFDDVRNVTDEFAIYDSWDHSVRPRATGRIPKIGDVRPEQVLKIVAAERKGKTL